MKIIFAIITFLFLSFSGFGQENKTIAVLVKPDTTYRFVEVTTLDGDTVNLRYFPPQWVKAQEFMNYTFGLAKASEERKTEAARIRAEADKELAFFSGAIDSTFGAGTYLNAVKAELQNSLQGTWTLIERNGKVLDRWTVNVSNLTATSGNRTGTLEISDGKTVVLRSFFNFNLTFSLRQNGTLAANRQGKTYILKRG